MMKRSRIVILLLLLLGCSTVYAAENSIVVSFQLGTGTPPVTPATTTSTTSSAASSVSSGGNGGPSLFGSQPASLATEPPANVGNYALTLEGENVRLVWSNPPFGTFDYIRIVRSERFYPRDFVDGVVVYEGRGTTALDRATEPGKTYYYGVFAKGALGVYSSGALASITVPSGDGPTTPVAEVQPPRPPAKTRLSGIPLSDFLFLQNGDLHLLRGSVIGVDPDVPTVVTFPAKLMPPEVKTVLFEITYPETQLRRTIYLFRPSPGGERYETTLPPFTTDGAYRFTVISVGYDGETNSDTAGEFLLTVQKAPVSTAQNLTPLMLIPIAVLTLVFIVAIGMFLVKLYTFFL